MTSQLFLGDCLEIMRQYPDRFFDVCVTDPPYGIGENREKVLSRGFSSTAKWKRAQAIDYGNFDWDSMPATAEQISEIRRISKNQVIFGGNYFALPPSPSWIVWDKQNGESDFSDCELAWTSYNRGIRIFRYLWAGFLKEKPEIRYHPTQKPLELMEWVILNYTKLGEKIIDPFAGAFTTGAACALTGRDFVGIEQDEKMIPVGEKRIHDAEQQPLLFSP